jgi:chemotaxis protein MotA
MNFSTALGFIGAAAVFLHSVLTSTDNRAVFLNEHGIVIVMGGTLAAASICFPIGKIFKLGLLAIKKMLFGFHPDYPEVIKYIIELGDKARADAGFLKKEVDLVKNPFLKEAIALVNDGMTEEQLRDILEQRIETHGKRYHIETNIFKTIAKFPPAFGLLGTTLGMIALLQKLGGENASKQIGPAMSIGLVATLYGISLTNFLFIPIAENLAEANREDQTLRKIILEGIIMLKNKIHPIMIEEKLNSYLLPGERVSLRADSKSTSPNAQAAAAKKAARW